MSYDLSNKLVTAISSRALFNLGFFDDQDVHVKPASEVVPSSRVPYKQIKDELKIDIRS